MLRNRRWLLPVLILMTGVIIGGRLQLPQVTQPTRAQDQPSSPDPNRVFINGNGVADSSKHPPIPWERFTLFASNDQQRSFKVVPPGKTLVVTDIMYNTRLVRQNLTVNLAKVTPNDKTQTLFQIYLKPGEQEETHLCTGYAIPAGYGLGAWTNAGLEPEQWVHIAISGYLIDETRP